MNYKDEICKLVERIQHDYLLLYFYSIMTEIINDEEAVATLRELHQNQSD